MANIQPKLHIDDKSGNVTFGGQTIGKLIPERGPRLVPDSSKPLDGNLIDDDKYVIGGKAKEMAKRLTLLESKVDAQLKAAHNITTRHWDSIREMDKHVANNHMAIVETNEMLDTTRDCLSEVCSKFHELTDRVQQLEAAKLDKPSFSPELLDAERYMDDYEEVRKKYRVQRFAQKQRTRQKLERIKSINNISKRRKDNVTTLIAAISIAMNVAILTYTVFF